MPLRMKFNGNSYRVSWVYDVTPIFDTTRMTSKPVRYERVTTCLVYLDPEEKVVLVGKVKCHYKDNHDKDKARKASLTKALRGLDKEVRTAIWEMYHREVGPIARARRERDEYDAAVDMANSIMDRAVLAESLIPEQLEFNFTKRQAGVS